MLELVYLKNARQVNSIERNYDGSRKKTECGWCSNNIHYVQRVEMGCLFRRRDPGETGALVLVGRYLILGVSDKMDWVMRPKFTRSGYPATHPKSQYSTILPKSKTEFLGIFWV